MGMVSTILFDGKDYIQMIYKAIKFAEEKHAGQVRKGSGKPYVTHPIVVSYLLAKYKQSKHMEELIVAAILHDTLEDTDTNFIEIAREFTPLVASLVLELTSDEEQIKIMGKNEYLMVKMCGISNYALVLKLLDRLNNISDQPKISYVYDTIVMMKHIKKKRRLTKTQKAIMVDILKICNEYNKENE